MRTFFIFVLTFTLQAGSSEDPSKVVEFKRSKIEINKKIVEVELAVSEEQQARGLMFRKSLNKDSGMLFIYDYERPLTFWMKNTFIPLSIAYFDRTRTLMNIEDMAASKSVMQADVALSKSKGRARYALEMNQGWFDQNGIKAGHKFEFVEPKDKDLGLGLTGPRKGSLDPKAK